MRSVKLTLNGCFSSKTLELELAAKDELIASLRRQLGPNLDWSLVRSGVNHILRQRPALQQMPQGMANHLALVGLADDWQVMSEMPAWKHLQDELRQFDQNLVQQTFEGKLKVEEVSLARQVIELVLGLPIQAHMMGTESREVVQAERGGEMF